MKKLIVVCMLAAIGAVTMIDRSNAAGPGQCMKNAGDCMGIPSRPHKQPGGANAGQPGQPNVPNGNWQGNHQWPNHQANNGNWPHRRHHNWNNGGWSNGGQPFIGFQFGPQYNDGYYSGYYDDAPDYYDGPPVYRYSSANRCNTLASRLRGAGYRNVRATDCVGTSFVFRATKAGKAVKVTMSARSGSIIKVAKAY
ncbi:hypothetical protein [Aestuariivirga litoralis]|uniref:hypothetical protein n=1 Tax=Aestuariivirga litoralis TaxID=2650924 RepID=UPI0018C5D882|nr:hypothetical protein [Aestuariivirga litoralis]MBG1232681.1 hypothetical protein [Aestuariivirga litoralis]